MIPLGESTAILPQVQGVSVRNKGFSLTLLQSAPRRPRQLSAVCVSSPICRAPSPILRKIQSSERRISSVSSLCRKSKVNEELEFWRRQSQQYLHESTSVLTVVPGSQQVHQTFSKIMTPEKEKYSSFETKTEQSLEFSSSYSNQKDVQDSSSSESKNLSKAKDKISLSRTSKLTNKGKKHSKSRKSCKRRNSTKKFSRKAPSVFERLTNSTTNSVNQHGKEKSKQVPSHVLTMLNNNGTLLEIRQLQASYSPKRSNKPKTFLLLPKVSKLTKFGKSLTTIKIEPENITSARRQKSLKMNSRREENIVSCKKIYLSEMQSKAIGGVPSAPPGTPSSGQLKKVEYVQSLTDIKSQRAIKSKLEKIVHQLRIEEQHRMDDSMKQHQKKLKESVIQLKQRQRLEIYALNRVMTELENENFKNFMNKKEAVSLGV